MIKIRLRGLSILLLLTTATQYCSLPETYRFCRQVRRLAGKSREHRCEQRRILHFAPLLRQIQHPTASIPLKSYTFPPETLVMTIVKKLDPGGCPAAGSIASGAAACAGQGDGQ